MRYYFFPAVLLIGISTLVGQADETYHHAHPPLDVTTFETSNFNSPVGANRKILGPTGDLLPPYLATKLKSDEDYFEWCLRWNKQQYASASQRAIPPRTISGRTTVRRGYSQSVSDGRFFYGRTRSRSSYGSTSQSREQEWQVGGYGGGPVSIYNPFAQKHRR